MNTNKLVYRASTILLSFFFVAGALMYFFNYERAHGFFLSLGFPTWIIYPLAVLKLLGAAAVLTRRSAFLKDLAYAGFLYDAALAFVAHVMVRDGEYLFSVIALTLTCVSWLFERRVYGSYRQVPAESPAAAPLDAPA